MILLLLTTLPRVLSIVLDNKANLNASISSSAFHQHFYLLLCCPIVLLLNNSAS